MGVPDWDLLCSIPAPPGLPFVQNLLNSVVEADVVQSTTCLRTSGLGWSVSCSLCELYVPTSPLLWS